MKNVKKALCQVAFSLMLPGVLLAQATQPQLIEKVEKTPGSSNIAYEKWKLANGLTIIVHEDHSDPIVHVAVTYHVGSARESLGKSGFAHFFEHMMFQGSEHVKDEEHFKIVSEAGGTMNGYTTSDETNYFETLPSNTLETALWLESDRMGFLLDSVTQKKFEVQRATVKNEKGQNFENRPYGLVTELLGQALYPASHPYSWPTIGYVDDLNRVNVQDLKDFFLRWYGPNNAVLTVAGDVNSAEVIAMANKYFGSINKCPDVRKQRFELPILANDIHTDYTDNIYFPLVMMTFPAAPMYSKDEPALQILAGIMGEGNNSIFYKNFVKTDKAIEASVSYEAKELAGEYSIQVLPYAENPFSFDFAPVEKEIRKAIEDFEKEGITDEMVDRQKAKIESQALKQVESVNGKATLLANWDLFVGKQFNLNDEIERYKKVTKEEVLRVFNKYIKGHYAAIVNVYPANPLIEKKDSVKSHNPYANYKPPVDPQYVGLKYVKPVDGIDRSKHPIPGTPKTPVVPAYFTNTLSNGLKVIGTQNSEVPKVAFLIELEGGNLLAEKNEKVGIAELTAGMLNEGTKNYTTEQISAELEKLGSTITFTGGKNNTTVYVECLKRNVDATLKLLEEKLLQPRFDQNDFYRVRKQLVESIKGQKTSAQSLAQDAFSNIIYGNNLFGAYPTEKNVKKLSLDDVKAYYEKAYSPSVASLVIVGDISKEEVMPKIQFLNNWKSKEVKMPEISDYAKIDKPQVYFVNRYKAAQSVVSVGELGLPYDATGDYFKMNIANYSLGGSFNSRINLNLREEKGFTYGANSSFIGNKYNGVFSVFTSVRASSTDSSVQEIVKEINNFVADGIKDEELSYTKSSLLSQDALKYETLNQKASFLSRIIKYNLPQDYISKQGEILKSIKKEDLNLLSKKYLNPSKMVIIVVGDKNKVRKPLDAAAEKMGMKVKEVFVD